MIVYAGKEISLDNVRWKFSNDRDCMPPDCVQFASISYAGEWTDKRIAYEIFYKYVDFGNFLLRLGYKVCIDFGEGMFWEDGERG